MSEYAPGEEYKEHEAAEGEPIAADKLGQAQPLINVFGEPNIRKIFSRTWGLREEGITNIEDEILNQNKYDPAAAFVGGVGVARNTVSDKISGVGQRSIQLIKNLCNGMTPNLSHQQQKEVTLHGDHIVSALVEKLGDNLAKVRQNTENALLAMCHHDAFGPQAPITHILRSVG